MFTDYLIRRQEHFDADIVRDITPTDGWIGHWSTGQFPPGEGVTRQWDRIHRVYPDLSGAWDDVSVAACSTANTPCDPTETEIGFGYTQESYTLQHKSYKTQVFCFDLIMSADRAKEQFSGLLKSLRDSSNIIVSDRLRVQAFTGAKRKLNTFATTALPSFTYTSTGNLTTMTPSALPASILTMEMLQRLVQPLVLEGYGGENPLPAQMFEYVTDIETAQRLREGNSSLTTSYQFTDFAQGGNLFKYGITDACGNFGFRIDKTPMRFSETGGVLHRVFPYKNVTATGGYGGEGIKGDVSDDYLNAKYQIDLVWHRMAAKHLTRQAMEINPMMPFARRDFGGNWQFAMHDLGADANGCVIANPRGNKGMFLADFEFSTKFEHPEWVVAILQLRQRACVTSTAVCAGFTAATHQAQNYSSANAACSTVVTFEIPADAGAYALVSGGAICNGVNIAHIAAAGLADQAAVVTWLNANLGELGTFAAGVDATHITLTGGVCQTFSAPFTSA